MNRMLSRIPTLIDSLLKGLIFWSHAEETVIVDTDASLPLTWFSEIPRCSFQCLYLPSLECGCSYLDFNCLCRAFEDVARDRNVEACIQSCPHNGDQLYAPGQILDFCELVGEDIRLPEYMDQYAALHRRANAGDEAITIYTTEYFHPTSTAHVATTTSSTSSSTSASTTQSDNPYTAMAITTKATSASTSASDSDSPSSATATATTGSSPLIPVSSSSSSSGLSTGAKAGIGVAIPLIAIIALLGLFWWLRKRRGNNATPDRNNFPEVSQTEQSWPKKLPLSAAATTTSPLPAEADGNPLSEVDSNSILPSHSRTTSAQSPIVHELSGNPSIRRPPPVALDSRRQAESFDRQSQSSETYFTGSHNKISRKAMSSSISSPGPELSTWMDVNASLENIEAGAATSSQQLSETNAAQDEQESELTQLETEMARIKEQRERLQQLHLLEEQEDQLKKRIAALRAGGSSV